MSTALAIAAFAVMPAAAQAVPHFYSNGVILPEESGGPGEGKDVISFGTLVLTSGTIGVITCLDEYGGDVYNPTGGGAGQGKIDGWIAYDCTNEVCETTFKSKQSLIPEGLENFGEWETNLTEPVAGKIRPKLGNSTSGSPTQIKFLISCPNTGLGEIKTKLKGELSPLTENGTAIGSAPSKLVFNKEAGLLELGEPPVKNTEVNGTLKILGYEGMELLSTKNP
jgi:hypothetical protein